MAATTTTPETIDSKAERPAGKITFGGVVSKIVVYLILGFWAVIVIFPMLWSIMSSFKSDQEIFFSPWALPKLMIFENFARAWIKARIGTYFINTLLIIIPALFLTLLLSSMANAVSKKPVAKGAAVA